MNQHVKLSAENIRSARIDNPKKRERELAGELGISEAEFVAAWCGDTVTRVSPDLATILPRLEDVGEVMALTRNESAVHEKIGVFDNYIPGGHVSMMLGKNIDMRIFSGKWVHAFAVEKGDGEDIRRSLQFFDAHGEAVHKIHLRPDSKLDVWRKLISDITVDDQSSKVEVTEQKEKPALEEVTEEKVETLRKRWAKMTDVHQFMMILRKLKLSRHQAVHNGGEDFAWQLDTSAVNAMMQLAVNDELPIMCFVGNHGNIQIHSGPITNIKTMGPWLNIMDPTFHLHLRTDHITEVWAVRKPGDKGHVTSLEAYDSDGEIIIQFFGQRQEGHEEREGWRFIMENLPRLSSEAAE
ncbi:MAG: hemin-degrading factor [Rhizobiaceae bacterium]|nr:hemin-degrading factor [Rhizobiaceae bacterium]